MSTLRRYVLSLVCVLAASSGPAGAAPTQPWAELAHASFRHHADGALAGGAALAQDQTGFIWLGTRQGLVRWDGQQTRRYLADPGRSGALPDSDIASLHLDARGRLWIGSGAGLARHDPAQDRFVVFPAGPGGLTHGRVAAIADDGRGGVWVGTGAGLEHIRDDGRVFPATSGAPRLAAASLGGDGGDGGDGGVRALLRERGGALWIGTRAGLFQRGADTQAPRPVALGAAPAAVNALLQDGRGRIWIGTEAGAWLIERAGAAPRAVGDSTRVLSIVEKSADMIWLGVTGGIVEVDARSGAARRLRSHGGARDGFPEADPAAMLRERGGQVFVASAAGLSQHDPRTQGVTAVRSTGADGKPGVTSLLARPNGQTWLGTSGGAIDILDPNSGRIARIDGRSGALPQRPIGAIAAAPDGAVYIGTPQGLYRSGADGGSPRRIALPGRADAPVSALAWHKDVLWLGGPDGLRALSLGAAPAVLRHEAASLGDSRVSAILPAADGSIWAGTGAGLARLDSASSGVERLPVDAEDPTTLAPGGVTAMLMDRKGRLWVASASSGVSVLERTDTAKRRWFKRLGAADGLPEGRVNVLVADRRGHIWIGTDDGLASVDPAGDRVRRFGAADGIPAQAYTSGAVQGDGGAILFGGPDGLTVVQPERLQRKAVLAPIAVTRVQIGGRELPAAPWNGQASARAALVLAPEDQQRGFALDFAALDFAPPQASRLSYRLQGFDQDWIALDGGARRASYTSLPPGRYTLQLRAGSAGGGDPAIHALAVEVQPAWHQRGWVRAAAILTLLGVGAALVRARIRSLRREQHALQAALDVRGGELKGLRNELERRTYTDALTGLPNRACLLEEMQRLAKLAEEGEERFTLLLIDLDGFDDINASCGQDAGDAVLVEVGQRLVRIMRDGDFVARLGDDEFAVLMPLALTRDIVERICGRIGHGLSKPIAIGEQTLQVDASMGGATFLTGKDGLARVRKGAANALREAKKAKRAALQLSQAA